MRNSIAVMNTKGGVGKSTILLAVAETLSAYHNKNVLVIDSDGQASISSMLMSTTQLYQLQSSSLTIVDYLVATVLQDQPEEWPRFVVRNTSDVDDAKSIYLIPSDVQLTLFEREVSSEGLHSRLRAAIRHLLDQVRSVFDIVLIDCPPGLSVLTESWLREADFHLTPTKADYISTCGLEVFRRFKAVNTDMGFADNLGVAVNMIDLLSPTDAEYRRWLNQAEDNNCFENVVPRANAFQDAARFRIEDRSYAAKYPGDAGKSVRALTAEILQRLIAAQTSDAPTNAPLPVSELPMVQAQQSGDTHPHVAAPAGAAPAIEAAALAPAPGAAAAAAPGQPISVSVPPPTPGVDTGSSSAA
ncbi:MAG: ParA family protein [Pseudomonadota bacterium]